MFDGQSQGRSDGSCSGLSGGMSCWAIPERTFESTSQVVVADHVSGQVPLQGVYTHVCGVRANERELCTSARSVTGGRLELMGQTRKQHSNSYQSLYVGARSHAEAVSRKEIEAEGCTNFICLFRCVYVALVDML